NWGPVPQVRGTRLSVSRLTRGHQTVAGPDYNSRRAGFLGASTSLTRPRRRTPKFAACGPLRPNGRGPRAAGVVDGVASRLHDCIVSYIVTLIFPRPPIFLALPLRRSSVMR